jgi:hypothetical protein
MTTYLLTRDAPERFARVFNFLAASKNTKTDEVKLEASFLVLADLPIESVEVAVQTLCKEANPFMPDDGSWYEVADNHAIQKVVIDTEQTKQLPPAQIERDEEDKLRKARTEFLATYKRITGHPLPNAEKWKTAPVYVVTYYCRLCSDTGWRSYSCTENDLCGSCQTSKHHLYDHDYVERCLCWNASPVLKAERARTQLHHRQRVNKRG